ncbi:MAG: FHA domain-containing protein, partial [Anaerolineales bacterium]|nr:FHA domain-containing protein [Anaerolineales bacterium]
IRPVGDLRAGRYQVAIIPTAREGLTIEPGEGTTLDFAILPFWQRCQKQLIRAGLSLGSCAFLTFHLANRIRKRRKPPIVTGLIRVWPDGKRHKVHEIDLTALQKPTIKFGSSPEADCPFSGPEIEPFHIEFRAISTREGTRVELVPLAPVQVGYRTYDKPFHIHHGDTFQIGNYCVQYLSDEGL